MATILKKFGKWQVSIRRSFHKPIYKTFISKQDAQRWSREKERLIEIGSYQDLSEANKTTLKQLLERYEREVSSKKKTPLATEKNNIIIAMSETPTEEYHLDLSTEIEQFQEWLKNNKYGTYKEYLKDKTALLAEEQKKDPKIIDLEPYPPNFEDVIKQYEKEQEEKKETLEEFIYRRGN